MDEYPLRINIELTNCCNLACSTCIRRWWSEQAGTMEEALARHVIDEAAEMPVKPKIFFGGFGEPLVYPGVEELVARAAEAGLRTELITNGILLDGQKSAALIEAGLDTLWVSIDGATPESFADIRLGAHLPDILRNLTHFRGLAWRHSGSNPDTRGGGGTELGFATVLMKKNLHELPQLLKTARQLGVSRIVTTNVDPHDEESAGQMLFPEEMYGGADIPPLVSLPRMDPSPAVLETFGTLLREGGRIDFGHMVYEGVADLCPFAEERSVSIRWDGEVAPCLPLLHDHQSRINDHPRTVRAASFGSLKQGGYAGTDAAALHGWNPVGGSKSSRFGYAPLLAVWRDPEYRRFRAKLDDFDFSPCILCDSCDFARWNEEDCFGNTHPTCGGCLWAQGFIRCP
jgi:MoaA/NifB/PqqE/SkfB family radical SAM enzyme